MLKFVIAFLSIVGSLLAFAAAFVWGMFVGIGDGPGGSVALGVAQITVTLYILLAAAAVSLVCAVLTFVQRKKLSRFWYVLGLAPIPVLGVAVVWIVLSAS